MVGGFTEVPAERRRVDVKSGRCNTLLFAIFNRCNCIANILLINSSHSKFGVVWIKIDGVVVDGNEGVGN